MTRRQKIIFVFLMILLLRFGFSLLLFNHDFYNHLQWAHSILNYGFQGFYERDFSPFAPANYPPLTMYLFSGLEIIFQSLPESFQSLNLHAALYKVPVLFSDSVIAYTLYQLGRNKHERLLFPSLFLLNLPLAFNSMFWGQLESLVTMFCLLSLLSFYSRRKYLCFIYFTLALLTKQNALFFTPIFLLLALVQTNLREKIIGFASSIILYYLTFIPFTARSFLTSPILFYLQTSGGQPHQHQASVHAFNYWYALGLNTQPDSLTFLTFSYRHLSLVITLFIVSLLIYKTKQLFVKRTLLYLTGLIALAVFMFLTRIHERHLYPGLVFTIPLLNSPKRYLSYLFLSLLHFLNLALVWLDYILDPPAFLPFINGLTLTLSFLSVLTFLYLCWDYLSRQKILSTNP